MGARWISLLVGSAVLLGGCSSSDASKAAICTKAVGVIVLAEANDDAQRRLQRAQDDAAELRKLSAQASDTSLSAALRDAASTAGQGSSHWSKARLQAWVTQEKARFDTVRKACV